MNRRGFLSLLGLGAAGLAIDPERLLWVPGQKTIFLPSVARFAPHPNMGMIVARAWEDVMMRHAKDDTFKSKWLFEQLCKPDFAEGESRVVTVAYA